MSKEDFLKSLANLVAGKPRSLEAAAEEIKNAVPLERKYVLMYLVDRLQGITRSEVVSLADVLYSDSKEGTVRPIAKVWHEVRSRNAKNGKNGVEKDPFLSRVALDYSKSEMEEKYTAKHLNPDGVGIGLIDALAGSGHSRPLLKELYSLSSLGIVSVRTLGNQEVFLPTHRAQAASKFIRIIFDHRERDLKGNNLLISVDAFEMQITHK